MRAIAEKAAGEGTEMIDHLVLRRIDGSEVRLDDVQASSEFRQIGAAVELSLPGSGVIRARVTQIDDQTTVSKIGDPNATGQLTVWAVELP
jgi:hypothetical protein